MDTEAFHTLPHADRLAYRAIKNALAELGEAVKALPEEVRKRHPEVDWKGFAGLRDLIAHQYFGIDTSRLLPMIRDELPDLVGGRGVRGPASTITIPDAVRLKAHGDMVTGASRSVSLPTVRPINASTYPSSAAAAWATQRSKAASDV